MTAADSRRETERAALTKIAGLLEGARQAVHQASIHTGEACQIAEGALRDSDDRYTRETYLAAWELDSQIAATMKAIAHAERTRTVAEQHHAG